MKRSKRIHSLILSLALVLVMMFANVMTAFAADDLSEDVKTGLATEVSAFLDQAFQYSDEELDQVAQSGDFYEVMADAIRDTKSAVGEYKKTGEVTVSESDDQVVAESDVQFSKLNAKVTIYFDQDTSSGQYTPRNFTIDPEYSLGQKMAQAGQNTLIGVVTVFLILLFLSFIISLFKYIHPKEEKQEEPVRKAAPKPAAPAPAAVPAPETASEDEAEIAAVIAAAIAAAQEENPSANGYVVRKIRRTGSGRGWKRA